MENEVKVPVINTAVKNGVIFGCVLIAITLVLWLVDASLLANQWVSIVPIFLVVTGIVITGVQMRNKHTGFLSYGQALLYNVIVFAVTLFLSSSFVVLLTNVIEPELAPYLGEIILENTIESYRSFGLSEAQIDAQYDQLKEASYATFTASKSLMNFAIAQVVHLIIFALLTSLIIKKNEPEEDLY